MSNPTREQVQEAVDRVHKIVGWQAYDPFSTIDTLVAAARLWLEGPPAYYHDKQRTCERTDEVLENYRVRAIRAEQQQLVDEVRIERAAKKLRLFLPDLLPSNLELAAKWALRAALEVTDE
jgi:hypothetical protein